MSNQINYNVTGSDRQQLVRIIGRELQAKPVYTRMPECAYIIGDLKVTKEGALEWDERTGNATIRHLVDALAEAGFETEDEIHLAEEAEPAPCVEEAPAVEERPGLTISLPKEGFTPESYSRLVKMLRNKADLIMKALGAYRLDFVLAEDKVEFPWWNRTPAPEEAQAYMAFIANLCALAKGSKRVNTTTGHAVESEKFAFRTWLLRMGFTGNEYKATRAVLLKNLSGPAAFPTLAAAEAFSEAQKKKRISAQKKGDQTA